MVSLGFVTLIAVALTTEFVNALCSSTADAFFQVAVLNATGSLKHKVCRKSVESTLKLTGCVSANLGP